MFGKRLLSLCLVFICVPVFLLSCRSSKPTNAEALRYLADTYQWNAAMDGNELRCTYQGKHNLRALLRARFGSANTEVQDPEPLADKYIIAAAMFGAWYQSALAFDYEAQFSLFHSDFPASVFEEQKNRFTGSLQEALVKVAETSRDLNPFDSYAVDYCSEPVDMTVDEFLELVEHGSYSFEEYSSIDPSLIQDVAALKISDVRLELNDGLYFDDVDMFSEYPFVIYQYDGHWYIWQRYIDDDTFYDLLGADPESNSYYYTRCTANGTVAAIRDNMVYLEGRTDAFFIGGLSDAEKISVGNEIMLNYYRGLGSRVKNREGVQCQVYSVYQIGV